MLEYSIPPQADQFNTLPVDYGISLAEFDTVLDGESHTFDVIFSAAPPIGTEFALYLNGIKQGATFAFPTTQITVNNLKVDGSVYNAAIAWSINGTMREYETGQQSDAVAVSGSVTAATVDLSCTDIPDGVDDWVPDPGTSVTSVPAGVLLDQTINSGSNLLIDVSKRYLKFTIRRFGPIWIALECKDEDSIAKSIYLSDQAVPPYATYHILEPNLQTETRVVLDLLVLAESSVDPFAYISIDTMRVRGPAQITNVEICDDGTPTALEEIDPGIPNTSAEWITYTFGEQATYTDIDDGIFIDQPLSVGSRLPINGYRRYLSMIVTRTRALYMNATLKNAEGQSVTVSFSDMVPDPYKIDALLNANLLFGDRIVLDLEALSGEKSPGFVPSELVHIHVRDIAKITDLRFLDTATPTALIDQVEPDVDDPVDPDPDNDPVDPDVQTGAILIRKLITRGTTDSSIPQEVLALVGPQHSTIPAFERAGTTEVVASNQSQLESAVANASPGTLVRYTGSTLSNALDFGGAGGVGDSPDQSVTIDLGTAQINNQVRLNADYLRMFGGRFRSRVHPKASHLKLKYGLYTGGNGQIEFKKEWADHRSGKKVEIAHNRWDFSDGTHPVQRPIILAYEGHTNSCSKWVWIHHNSFHNGPGTGGGSEAITVSAPVLTWSANPEMWALIELNDFRNWRADDETVCLKGPCMIVRYNLLRANSHYRVSFRTTFGSMMYGNVHTDCSGDTINLHGNDNWVRWNFYGGSSARCLFRGSHDDIERRAEYVSKGSTHRYKATERCHVNYNIFQFLSGIPTQSYLVREITPTEYPIRDNDCSKNFVLANGLTSVLAQDQGDRMTTEAQWVAQRNTPASDNYVKRPTSPNVHDFDPPRVMDLTPIQLPLMTQEAGAGSEYPWAPVQYWSSEHKGLPFDRPLHEPGPLFELMWDYEGEVIGSGDGGGTDPVEPDPDPTTDGGRHIDSGIDKPELLSPLPGSSVTGNSIPVSWESNGLSVINYYVRLYEGPSADKKLLFDSNRLLPGVTSLNVTGSRPLSQITQPLYLQFSYKPSGIGEWVQREFVLNGPTPQSFSINTSVNRASVSAVVNMSSSTLFEYAVYVGRSSSVLELDGVGTEQAVNHAHTINGLQPETTYWYQVKGYDQYGQESVSSIGTFTTSPGVIVPVGGADEELERQGYTEIWRSTPTEAQLDTTVRSYFRTYEFSRGNTPYREVENYNFPIRRDGQVIQTTWNDDNPVQRIARDPIDNAPAVKGTVVGVNNPAGDRSGHAWNYSTRLFGNQGIQHDEMVFSVDIMTPLPPDGFRIPAPLNDKMGGFYPGLGPLYGARVGQSSFSIGGSHQSYDAFVVRCIFDIGGREGDRERPERGRPGLYFYDADTYIWSRMPKFVDEQTTPLYGFTRQHYDQRAGRLPGSQKAPDENANPEGYVLAQNYMVGKWATWWIKLKLNQCNREMTGELSQSEAADWLVNRNSYLPENGEIGYGINGDWKFLRRKRLRTRNDIFPRGWGSLLMYNYVNYQNGPASMFYRNFRLHVK